MFVKYFLARQVLSGQETSGAEAVYTAMQRSAGYEARAAAFVDLVSSIRDNGFDPAYPIPVDANYDVLDGTHRLAACLALGVFPKVQVFSCYSKQFGFARLASIPGAMALAHLGEQSIAERWGFAPGMETSVAIVWGMSISAWDRVLERIGYHEIFRAFRRVCEPETFARVMALSYAGDGISDSSLLRKIWVQLKFRTEFGVVAIQGNNEKTDKIKLSIRDRTIPELDWYHYDSLMHSIDNRPHGLRLLSALQPRKPVGIENQVEDFRGRIRQVFYEVDSRNTVFRPVGPEVSSDVFMERSWMEIRERFKLVIFDLDGVIVDTERISAAGYQLLLAGRGLSLSIEDALELFSGRSSAEGRQLVKERFCIEFTEDERARKRAWIRRERSSLKPIPGIVELIKKLDCAKCIASGSGIDVIDRTLSSVGLECEFPHNARFSASMVVRGKPAPDLFLHCASRFGTPVDQCIVIEDSLPGIAAAKAAGMHFIWFSGSIHSAKYADQIVHYAGVRGEPSADRLADSLLDYGLSFKEGWRQEVGRNHQE